MRSLGRNFLLVLATGLLGAAIAAIAAVLQWWSVAFFMVAVALVAVLGCLVLLRRDLVRLRTAARVAGPTTAAVGTVVAQRSPEDEVRLVQQVRSEVDHAIRSALPDDPRGPAGTTPGSNAQFSALLTIHARHQPPSAPFLDLPGAMPAQFAAVLDHVKQTAPRRVLGIGCGDAGLWLAHAVHRAGGSTILVTAQETEPAGLRARWQAMTGTGSDGDAAPSLAIHHVGQALPGTPHSYLPWFDLSGLGPTADHELVVVCVPSNEDVPAARPVLPLMGQFLSGEGTLVPLESNVRRPVGAAWAATPGWEVATVGNNWLRRAR